VVDNIVNTLIEGVATLGEWVVSLLPQSPFRMFDNALDSSLLGHINYFIPVSQMMDIFVLWGAAVGGFYAWKLVLRWAKAIQ
jgi:hypothetical protein